MNDSKENKKRRMIGPGLLVTAAFIGPGTVTAASKAGANHSFMLLWVILFSVVATIILQEMAARLGILTGLGLGDAVRFSLRRSKLRWVAVGLIVAAIGIGNAAFQVGNLSGGATGLSILADQVLTGEPDSTMRNVLVNDQAVFAFVLGAIAFGVLLIGELKLLQNILIGLVVVMSTMFVITAFSVRPSVSSIASGMIPKIPETDGITSVLALIGTTIVAYNFFLHSTTSAENWRGVEKKTALFSSRIDTILSIALGGLVTAAILVTAAAATVPGDEATKFSLMNVGKQLEPTFGKSSSILFGIGLFAAGLTSAITAPLATGYAMAGCFGWKRKLKDKRFRLTVLGLCGLGTLVAVTLKASPSAIIIFAQVANGLLLPLIVVFLIYVMNQGKLLGDFRNRWLANSLGVLTLIFVSFLSIRVVYLKSMSVVEQITSWFG